MCACHCPIRRSVRQAVGLLEVGPQSWKKCKIYDSMVSSLFVLLDRRLDRGGCTDDDVCVGQKKVLLKVTMNGPDPQSCLLNLAYGIPSLKPKAIEAWDQV